MTLLGRRTVDRLSRGHGLPAVPGPEQPAGLLARAGDCVVQATLLAAIAFGAEALTRALGLPLPSNVLGLLLLWLLLHTRLVQVDQVERCASWLVRHLAFFFIPIAVGLMAYTDLLAGAGLRLLLMLGVSVVLGVWVAGWVSQALQRRRP